MRAFTFFLLAALTGCSLLGEDGTVTLDGPYTDYDSFLNAFRPPYPTVSGRFIHFGETQYVLSSRVDCRTLPVESVRSLELLKIPGDVDVEEWIRYHNADFGNEYTEIEPERYALLSGTVRLADVTAEEEARSSGDGAESVQVVHYRLEAQGLSFEGGVEVPSLKTDDHACYVEE